MLRYESGGRLRTAYRSEKVTSGHTMYTLLMRSVYNDPKMCFTFIRGTVGL